MAHGKGAPRLYIFDMGGVLVGNVRCVPVMAASMGLTDTEFLYASGGAPASDAMAPKKLGDIRAIQEGFIGAEEFWLRFESRAEKLFPDRHIRLPRRVDGLPEDLWSTFYEPIRDAAVGKILDDLKTARRRVVCGTNTMSAHYERHRAHGDYSYFHRVYASHLMGAVKPEAAFWLNILDAEGVGAGDTFFTDDSKANVEAASALGIQAHHFSGADELRATLEKLGAFG